MDFNKVILAGRLTRDPKLSYLPNQTAVCDFGMAINRKWKDRDGNTKEEACFIDIQCFGRLAETLHKYVDKGDSLLIEGRLRLETWQSKDGSNRSKHKVIADRFCFVPKQGSDSGRSTNTDEELPF